MFLQGLLSLFSKELVGKVIGAALAGAAGGIGTGYALSSDPAHLMRNIKVNALIGALTAVGALFAPPPKKSDKPADKKD